LDIVKKVAGAFAKRAGIKGEDLMGEAFLGLLDAQKSYDESRGASFRTYASRKIWHRLQDWARNIDFVPHRVRAEIRAGKCKAPRFVRLDHLRDRNHPGARDQRLEEVDRRDEVRRCLKFCRPIERNALCLYFLDGLTMKVVGQRLGLSEPSISLLISRAIRAIRRNLPMT
jgi:RNA polymerase sigma factor for flagellar operon FliA